MLLVMAIISCNDYEQPRGIHAAYAQTHSCRHTRIRVVSSLVDGAHECVCDSMNLLTFQIN